jgi:hypothetical protein
MISKTNDYDVFLCHDGNSPNLLCYVSYQLVQLGLKVYYNQIVPTIDESYSSTKESACMMSSRAIVVFISKSFQINELSLQILRDSRKLKTEPLVVPVFIDPNSVEWRNQEISYLCQLHSSSTTSFDLSKELITAHLKDKLNIKNSKNAVPMSLIEGDAVETDFSHCDTHIQSIAIYIKRYFSNIYGRIKSMPSVHTD